MNNSQFAQLGLSETLCLALNKRNHTPPTPIQQEAIPHLLSGRDLLGLAQTGTGKTGAFSLPILHLLAEAEGKAKPNKPRALILAPTRELAIQIGAEIEAYKAGLSIRHTVIFGGVSQNRQVEALRRGIDILVATPGRLLDLRAQGHVRFSAVRFFVLDEADRMLDMGFIRDIRKIVPALPEERQSLLFSATMPKEIAGLAADLLTDPVRAEVAPQATPIERIEQYVHHVPTAGKRAVLEKILSDPDCSKVIVFAKMKHRTNRIAEQLCKAGIEADAINGNKSQNARQRALKRFKSGEVRVLVATDIAARGIDIDSVTHVINYELPNEPESYVHRIGRTARAGAAGTAISLCDQSERGFLRDIERLIGAKIPVVGEEPEEGAQPEKANKPRPAKGKGRRRNRRRGKNRQPESARKAA